MAEKSFLRTLVTDVAKAIERHDLSDGQPEKRDLVRTIFAAIEGVAWIFREHIIETAASSYGLHEDEVATFAETAYIVGKNGSITRQPRFIPLLNSIRLTARIAERLASTKHIDFSARGWEQIQHAFGVRNRVTHPKNADDLALSDSDLTESIEGFFWLLNEVTDVMAATNKAVAAYLGDFRDVFEKLESGDHETRALYDYVKEHANFE